jgi:hypothetical protein
MTTAPVNPRRRPTTWLALALLAVSLGMVGFLWVSLALPGVDAPGGRPTSWWEIAGHVASSVTLLSIPLVGAIVSIQRPRNPIGWLMLTVGASFLVGTFSTEYVHRSIEVGGLPGYRLLDWLTPTFTNLGFIGLVLWLPLLFPNGLPPGRRWRAIAWLAAAMTVIGIITTPLVDDPSSGRLLPNPVASQGAVADFLALTSAVLYALVIVMVALVFLSVVVRARAARGVERQQMKWFLAAIAVLAISTAVATTGSDLANVGFLLGLNFLPIAIGIAILRYRLYDIDRLISRTIGWALVTGILVGVFAGAVIGLQALLASVTQGETLAVAASTLAAFALFQPLRRRIQVAVDRRFDRTRYDGQRTVDAFAERLRDEVELEAVSSDLRATAVGSVNPSRAGLWLRRSVS